MVGHFNDFDLVVTADVRNLHVVEAVFVRNVLIVEPRTVAGLPGCSADHAELGGASTSHVVAAFLKLYYCLAVVTLLPTLFFSHLFEAI